MSTEPTLTSSIVDTLIEQNHSRGKRNTVNHTPLTLKVENWLKCKCYAFGTIQAEEVKRIIETFACIRRFPDAYQSTKGRDNFKTHILAVLKMHQSSLRFMEIRLGPHGLAVHALRTAVTHHCPLQNVCINLSHVPGATMKAHLLERIHESLKWICLYKVTSPKKHSHKVSGARTET